MSALDINNINQQVPCDGTNQVPRGETAPEGRATELRDSFQRRHARIEEYLQESLEHTDALTSIIGTQTADLMSLQLQFGEALREALGPGRAKPEDLNRNLAGIEMTFKLAKQVAQYTQLHRKLRKDAEPPAADEEESEETTN